MKCNCYLAIDFFSAFWFCFSVFAGSGVKVAVSMICFPEASRPLLTVIW